MAEHLIRVSGHLQERRGIYHIMLSWQVNGKRQRTSISTGLPKKGNKKRAEDMLGAACATQEELLATKVDFAPNDEMLFSDFLEKWLSVVKPELKPTTFGNYQSAITRTIAPYFRAKRIKLCEVSADDILAFYSVQMEKVKATTIHKYHNNFSRAFQYAIDEGIIEHSPMDKVKRPRAERYAALFLRQSEAIALFEAIKGHKLELGVIMAAYYGLRRGEIVGLRWESIDFERNTITIEHTVTVAQVDGKKTVVESDTAKTLASLRTLPLVPQFRALLLTLKEEKEYYRKLCGNSYNKKEGRYIYTDALGNRIRPDYLTAEFPRWMEKNGFRRLRFHDLRHSCASLLLANGVPLKQIQEWLGHSSFKITADAYAHLEYASKIAAANAMTWLNETSLGGSESVKEAS
ncbi:site-specific integrase [Ruminococcaceae bacterium OttesenSCG-928-D13]|nr:site-specific integrase [Ruminococcaceae bacterium OttesenSCG-928-D13]